MSAHPRIAANDPALAHALMHRAVIEEGSAVAKRLKALLPAAVTVPKLSVAIQKSFGPQLVLQQVGRLHGSRANAIWVVMVTSNNGDLMPLLLDFHHQHLHNNLLGFTVRGHAMARMAQRTIRYANMTQASGVLVKHMQMIFLSYSQAETDRPGRRLTMFNTITQEGVLLWRREDGEWYAYTWLDPETAADPLIRSDCANATTTHGRFRVIATEERT
jgi:hypothetical protein